MKLIIHKLGIYIILLISTIMSTATASGYEVNSTKNYYAKFIAQTPIDVGLDVNGVKLDSVFFDKNAMQAFLILRNRTPVSANPTVGVSVFDKKGKMIATGIDVTEFSFTGESISAGNQKNIKLSLNKFINDFNDADSFQIVFSLGKYSNTSADNNSVDGDEDVF